MIKTLALLFVISLPPTGTMSLETPKVTLTTMENTMSIDKTQLEDLITRVLLDANLWSREAVDLLMLTAAQESHLGTYIVQKGGGPAQGIFQMEPLTEEDIWHNYLEYREDLRDYVLDTCPEGTFSSLETDLVYQILMARLHYRRVPSPLPKGIEGMANYWKKFYNTNEGKGTVEEAVANYKRFVL